jgi:hypothetical protein
MKLGSVFIVLSLFSGCAGSESGDKSKSKRISHSQRVFSCTLQAKSKSMLDAKRESDEILLPAITSDTGRYRHLLTARSELIDAFGKNPKLEYMTSQDEGKVNLFLNLTQARTEGMRLDSNYVEAGFIGNPSVDQNDLWLTHENILDGNFRYLSINITNPGSSDDDARERVYIFCGFAE